MNIAVVGCGLIGKKRALAFTALGARVVVVMDLDLARAEDLAAPVGATASDSLADIIENPAIDAVVIATTHRELAPIAVACLAAGKHVLVEKPGGRNLQEVASIAEAAAVAGRIAKVGYNHRFHPAIVKSRQIVDSGVLGPLMFIRGRYGHGGRPGYDQEWRFNKDMSGGGQMIDQGSHLIDLAHWFLGDFTQVFGVLPTYFWRAEVEDNVFLTLSTEQGQVAWLHATWTEWKNMFSFEIYGRDGKLSIDGLGGSYGVERLTHYRMLPGMGPPETTAWEYPFPDRSWDAECAEFLGAIEEGRRPNGDVADALSTMSVIERIYQGAGQ